MTVTRFAPSPTGHLHVGNIRTALHNWLLAKQAGGRFLLRIDDTDAARSKEEYVEAIRADLAWLGLHPEGEERQSARFGLYEGAFERLKAQGRVYPCWETPQELELRRKVLLGRGLPPIYDRAALSLSEEDKAARLAAGEMPHWRFLLDRAAPIEWEDGIRGPQHFDPAMMSDPVVRRADGSWLYMLPSAIDDIDMGVTDILRGEDHVSNTAAQVQMFTALGVSPPRFAHEALLVGTEGKLSKRLGSLGAMHFRESGIEPQALVALLGRLGTSDPVDAALGLEELAASFDLSRFGRAPARFDEAELERVNAAVVHALPYEAAAARLPEGMDAAAWETVRPNLTHVHEAADWWRVVTGPVEAPAFPDEDRTYLAQAAEALSALDWDAGNESGAWKALTGVLKDATGRKGKALFLPLRQALTGMDHGPDMGALLPLIGRDAAVARLRAVS
ncbi:glutamate--tRNA ligase [Novosphingobium mangrovi (ex Huang et al. 2023)]|uniref:Glutamate--tRNA ligase n=1 Tax=Novosphingobium mangrovi (ex Huang et al. 2023) TaxID=2976432 RepID=A0ABT2I3A3_9SPHN|nr:glutamate--tRNA ligase [Novosphingobium mangrovi (ex Huang et al. 2023)]MCT2399287.1 glutamate--tRNA ligase [Novosphingobium mangrovi (ex Huang et al. 2023)]